MGGSHNWVTANTNAGGEAQVTQLVHELVGQGARLGNQTKAAGSRDIGRSNADIALSGANDSGAVRADQAHATLKRIINESGRILNGDTFGDDDQSFNSGINSFNRRVLGVCRGHEDNRNICTSFLTGLRNASKHGNLNVTGSAVFSARAVRLNVEGHRSTGLAGVHTADNIRAGSQHAGRVFLAF